MGLPSMSPSHTEASPLLAMAAWEVCVSHNQQSMEAETSQAPTSLKLPGGPRPWACPQELASSSEKGRGPRPEPAWEGRCPTHGFLEKSKGSAPGPDGNCCQTGLARHPRPVSAESFRDGLQVGEEPAPRSCVPASRCLAAVTLCPLLCKSSGPSFTSAQAEIWRDGTLVTGVAVHPTGIWLAWHTPCR